MKTNKRLFGVALAVLAVAAITTSCKGSDAVVTPSMTHYSVGQSELVAGESTSIEIFINNPNQLPVYVYIICKGGISQTRRTIYQQGSWIYTATASDFPGPGPEDVSINVVLKSGDNETVEPYDEFAISIRVVQEETS